MNTEDILKALGGMNVNQLNIVTGEHAKIVYQEVSKDEEPVHFPLNKSKDEGVMAYDFLSQGGYIPESMPMDSFLFLLGYVEQRPRKIVAIKWLTTKEQLRVMLRLNFQGQIDKKQLKVADLERLTPKVFCDKQGNPLTLAKPSVENSFQLSALEDFFRPSSDH